MVDEFTWVMFRRYGGQLTTNLHAIPTEYKTRPPALCGAGNSMHTSIVHTTMELPRCYRCTLAVARAKK